MMPVVFRLSKLKLLRSVWQNGGRLETLGCYREAEKNRKTGYDLINLRRIITDVRQPRPHSKTCSPMRANPTQNIESLGLETTIRIFLEHDSYFYRQTNLSIISTKPRGHYFKYYIRGTFFADTNRELVMTCRYWNGLVLMRKGNV